MMLRGISAAILNATALAFAISQPLSAQDTAQVDEAEQSLLEQRSEQVVDLLNGELAIPVDEVFTEAFLAAVPPSQLSAISQQLTNGYGRALAVETLNPREGTRAALDIRFERGIARGGIAIVPAAGNRIGELVFRSVDPIAEEDDSFDKIEADLQALPGTVGAYFGPVDGSGPSLAMNADQPMAIGSTFKLYVLSALAQSIADGERGWSDVVPLSGTFVPSGIVKDWPGGAPVTLHTLATLMISVSDNLATDMLIDVVGRERVFAKLVESGHSDPALNDPFLNTREFFLLKMASPELRAQYLEGDAEARTAIIEGLDGQVIEEAAVQAAFAGGPVALDLEWLARPDDQRRLLAQLAASDDPRVREILAVNRSVPSAVAEKWTYVGYKGGSEPGVLNLAWLLEDADGQNHALVLSWNNPEAQIESPTLRAIAQRIMLLGR